VSPLTAVLTFRLGPRALSTASALSRACEIAAWSEREDSIMVMEGEERICSGSFEGFRARIVSV